MTDSLQHIFFDLDNTLWDFDANSRETLHELFDSFQLASQTKESSSYFVERYLFHNERFWDLYRQNRISKSRLRRVRFEEALADIGITDRQFAHKVGEAYLDQCPRKTKLIDGAVEVLHFLKDSYNLHILSNGFQDTQLTKLSVSGILSCFNEVVTSERASSKKPQKRIFDYALQAIKATSSQCLMIGDNLEIDIKGAVDNGWLAIHYNPARIAHEHKSVGELRELMGLLGK